MDAEDLLGQGLVELLRDVALSETLLGFNHLEGAEYVHKGVLVNCIAAIHLN